MRLLGRALRARAGIFLRGQLSFLTCWLATISTVFYCF